jgi:3-oxoacyl-(acyl-carrier-protein) synthase
METAMGGEVTRVWLGADAMITALGSGTEAALAAIDAGRIGCGEVNDPALWGAPFVAGRIARGAVADAAGYTRLENLFAAVIDEVIARSGVDPAAADTALVMASTKGNVELLTAAGARDERVSLGGMARRVASRAGFVVPPTVISNACVSGVTAMIVARRLIREGRYRNVVVAGGDTLSRFVMTGFQAFRSVSGAVCRPYDAARDGLTLGEACAAMLLTADRSKATLPAVEVAGGAVAGDANHISAPSRTGDGLHHAIRGAMEEAGATPAEVAFVNGHGTGTLYNDEMESRAYALAGLDAVPVNGLKPYFGHTLGAAGVVETIVSAHALRVGTVHATPGFENCGTPVALDVSPHARATDKPLCVKTASGFGGCNAAIVLRKGDDPQTAAAETAAAPTIRETAAASVAPDGRPFGEMIRERFRALKGPDGRFSRMDNLSKLACTAAGELLQGARLSERYRPEEVGVVLANSSASLDADVRHLAYLGREGEASPALFVYTLPNVCAGEVSIRHKIQGEATFFIEPAAAFADRYARMLLRTGYLKAVICGRVELFGEAFSAELKLLETK